MGRPTPPSPTPARRQPGAAAPAVRPRRGRIVAASSSLLVTLVSLLGGMGVLPAGTTAAVAAPQAYTAAAPATLSVREALSGLVVPGQVEPGVSSSKPPAARTAGREVAPAVPADSGEGRRVVFDQSAQRVWLVGRSAGRDVVRRTYLVSGSLTDNLAPGEYDVYSRSMHAVGVEDSGTMRYMVRFARGERAAIGFHDIPVLDGRLVQTYDELGTPRSHGCVRQWRPDAQALWRFAPVGTPVVVVA